MYLTALPIDGALFKLQVVTFIQENSLFRFQMKTSCSIDCFENRIVTIIPSIKERKRNTKIEKTKSLSISNTTLTFVDRLSLKNITTATYFGDFVRCQTLVTALKL